METSASGFYYHADGLGSTTNLTNARGPTHPEVAGRQLCDQRRRPPSPPRAKLAVWEADATSCIVMHMCPSGYPAS
jgi:hypothetical protein